MSDLPHEDDDKGGKLRRKRAAQARAFIVLVAFVGFIFLVSITKMNHHKYMPTSSQRRTLRRKEQQDKALELATASRQMAESSFLPPDSIYNLSVNDMQGKTKVSYEELSILQEQFAQKGFSVLAFPISDFHQELPTNDAILEFVQQKFPQTNFPIFGLSSLAENPVYETLQRTSGKQVQWNFFKYLVDRKGKVVKVYTHHDNPFSLTADIEKVLAESEPHKHKLVTH